ncbi:uncharacterized protein LOC125812027, partial [Solanum verrucosum]|uniref:uncharacterized protein LOC125812027 n=1 Tax=Solanum verrucosum TaxID=315347 RepID=UPI0020D03BB6
RGRPARRNIEEQELPNAPEVQPQGEVSNAEFREAIRMLSQVVTNQVGQQRGARQEKADTSRIHEFLRMNPPSFTISSSAEDLENFIEELKKVLDVMHVVDTARVELAAYQMKNVARTWMSLFVAGLGRLSSNEGRATMLIMDMDISRLMVYVQQGSVAQGGSKPPACAKCGINHSGIRREGSTGCFKCGQSGHFMRECPKNKQGHGATSGTSGGTNRLYAINSRQKQEDSPDVVTGTANVVYDALNSLSMGSTSHVDEEKRELEKVVHRLARLEV